MLYRPTTTRAELEALRTVQEGPTLDYKDFVKHDEWWELAKDISAFANHLGGDLLIGVGETSENTADPRGLPSATIDEIQKAYEFVARDRCRPTPLATFDRIPWDDGRQVLAVHIEAHPAGLVAAQFYELNQAKEPTAANAWQFALRVGKHNKPLTPDQFPMLMSAEIRRSVILLESIPEDSRATVLLAYRALGGEDYVHSAKASFETADVLANTATFFWLGNATKPIHVPLEDVEAVWLTGEKNWCVRLSGYCTSKENGMVYGSRPRRG